MNIRFDNFNFCHGRRRNVFVVKKSGKERGRQLKQKQNIKGKQNKTRNKRMRAKALYCLVLR